MQNLTKKDMLKAVHSMERLKGRYHAAVAKHEETMERVVGGIVSAGASFGFGALQGKFAARGGLGIMGVPIELVAAGGCYLAAALDLAGGMSHHIYQLGQGALCAFTTTMGRGVGIKMANDGVAPKLTAAPTAVRGEATLSPQELAALANPTAP